MAVKVPPEQIELIKGLLDLDPAQIDEFLKALAEAEPKFNVADLTDSVSKRVKLSQNVVSGLVRVLKSLYLTRDRMGMPTEKFVDEEILTALTNSKVFTDDIALKDRWPKLRIFFTVALSLDRTLGTAAKAGEVLTQHEHIFHGARILTDIRPIFHLDVTEKPEAAVIIHMLHITERNNQREFSDRYYAMDSNDIRFLKTLLDRAIKKEETLRKAMQTVDIACLYPKATY